MSTSLKAIELRVSPPSVKSTRMVRPSASAAPSRYTPSASYIAVMPAGLARADALDHPRKVLLRVARDADLGVEVHQRHVGGVGEGVEKAHGGRARQRDVFAHAAARVEEQADVGLDGAVLGVAAGEVGDGLRAAVLDHGEVGPASDP